MDITQRCEDSPMSFDMELDVEEDIAAELENFILLVRLGIEDEASQILGDVLWPHIQQFPVFAEAVGFLLPHLLNTTPGPIRNQAFRLLNESRSTEFKHSEENELVTMLDFVQATEAKDQQVQATKIKSLLPAVDFSLLKSGDYGSIVQLHVFELLSIWASSNHDLYELVAHFFVQHFERLLIENLPREAAQVFAHLCKHYHSAELFRLNKSAIARDFLIVSYTKMMVQTNAEELLHSITSEKDAELLEADTDRALTILSAQASMLQNYYVSQAIPMLREEFTILLSAVFFTQDDQMPRGSYYDVFVQSVYVGDTISVSPELFRSIEEAAKMNYLQSKTGTLSQYRPELNIHATFSPNIFEELDGLQLFDHFSRLLHTTDGNLKRCQYMRNDRYRWMTLSEDFITQLRQGDFTRIKELLSRMAKPPRDGLTRAIKKLHYILKEMSGHLQSPPVQPPTDSQKELFEHYFHSLEASLRSLKMWLSIAEDASLAKETSLSERNPVQVIGSFTTPPWGVRVSLVRDNPTPGPGHDYWSAHVESVPDHAEYKFVLRRGSKEIWKLDPYCRDATGRVRVGDNIYNNSIVDDPAFEWGNQHFRMPNWNELVIYEMHIGTFNNVEGRPGTFDDAVKKIEHLVQLGVNAIEVMPAHDFESEFSMGYNPNLLFVIDDAYGTQNAVQKFVKAAHSKGIAVIFDVVYNHFGPDVGDCLWQFDGWSKDGRHDLGGIYFYNEDRATCDFGDRPDFGRSEVRQFIRDNAMMWLHEYRADGLRFDSTHNIRRAVGKGHDRGELPEGWALMQWINNDKDRELPWNLTIAEDLQNEEWITKETGAGGAGFNSQWDVSFFHALKDVVTAAADESRDVGKIADALQKRYNHDAFRRVVYSESHDEVTIQKGNWLGRMPEKISPGHAAHWKAKKLSTLAAVVTLTAPGIPMLFQGQEFLEPGTWTDNPEIRGANSMLDWSKKNTFHGIFRLYSRLVRLRRNNDHNTRGLTGQHINVFHVNHQDKVIAYHRWMDGGPGDDVIVVANFSQTAYDSYNIGFPRLGSWYLRFNSDWSDYDSEFRSQGYDTTANHGHNQGMRYQGNVGIGSYSAIILSQ